MPLDKDALRRNFTFRGNKTFSGPHQLMTKVESFPCLRTHELSEIVSKGAGQRLPVVVQTGEDTFMDAQVAELRVINGKLMLVIRRAESASPPDKTGHHRRLRRKTAKGRAGEARSA